MQALANLIRLAEDYGTDALTEGVYEAAEAEALRYGYFETEMDIVSDWFTASHNTWAETLAFLDDPFTLQWLARMSLAGWGPYDVNHRPVTQEQLHRFMTAWAPHRQDECWAWIRAEETTDHRFEGPEHALGEWIRRNVPSYEDEPHGERVVFVDRGRIGADPCVDVVTIDGTRIEMTIPLGEAIALYGDCRTTSRT